MVKTLLRTYGTSSCLVCGNTLRFDETCYCAECILFRGNLVSRLENDVDLLRTVFICSRKGAPVPKALLHQLTAGGKEIGQAISLRLKPLQDFLALSYLKHQVAPAVMGALWVDLSADLRSLYLNEEKRTDAWKTTSYNDDMIPVLGKMYQVQELSIGIESFRKLRDKGYDLLFPKGEG